MGILKGDRWLPRDVAKLCKEEGWHDVDNLALFVATVGGESAYYSEAISSVNRDGTYDFGLFQLNSGHAVSWGMTSEEFRKMAYDPVEAVKYARKLWDADKKAGGTGFSPWYAYANGGYEHWLKQAIAGVANMLAVENDLDPRFRWI